MAQLHKPTPDRAAGDACHRRYRQNATTSGSVSLTRGPQTSVTLSKERRKRLEAGFDGGSLLVHWVPYVVGNRSSITVAMDWTDFDADGQATIMLWLTVDTTTPKDRHNDYENQILMRLAEVLPAAVRVRIVADRGFGDQKLYRMLTDELKFDVVIRFRGNIKVTAADGEAWPAAEWVGAGGRARVLRGAAVTAAGYPVATVVCVQAKNMKQPWCLATRETARARSATRRTCASAWEWVRCTSAPPTGATASG